MEKTLSPRKKLRELLQSHLQYILNNNFSLVIFFREKEKIPANETQEYVQNRNRYENIFRMVLAAGIRNGEFPEVDVNLTVFAILGMCNWVIQWYNPRGSKNQEEITEHMVYLICDLMLNRVKNKTITI